MLKLEDKIEQYLLEELPQEDSKAFEKAIEKDPKLAKSVAEHQIMMERLEAFRLRNKVKKVLGESKPDTFKGSALSTIRFFWLMVAGLLLFATGLGLLQYFYIDNTPKSIVPPTESIENTKPQQAIEPQKMAKETSPPTQTHSSKSPIKSSKSAHLIALAHDYQQDATQVLVREALESRTTNSKTTLQLAAEQYELGNYGQSADLLKSENAVATKGAARFLRANARFQLGQFANAAADFEVLFSSFMFQYDARWNYMLCQLALGKMDKAQGLLNEMAADLDFPFQRQALALKEKLIRESY